MEDIYYFQLHGRLGWSTNTKIFVDVICKRPLTRIRYPVVINGTYNRRGSEGEREGPSFATIVMVGQGLSLVGLRIQSGFPEIERWRVFVQRRSSSLK